MVLRGCYYNSSEPAQTSGGLWCWRALIALGVLQVCPPVARGCSENSRGPVGICKFLMQLSDYEVHCIVVIPIYFVWSSTVV